MTETPARVRAAIISRTHRSATDGKPMRALHGMATKPRHNPEHNRARSTNLLRIRLLRQGSHIIHRVPASSYRYHSLNTIVHAESALVRPARVSNQVSKVSGAGQTPPPPQPGQPEAAEEAAATGEDLQHCRQHQRYCSCCSRRAPQVRPPELQRLGSQPGLVDLRSTRQLTIVTYNTNCLFTLVDTATSRTSPYGTLEWLRNPDCATPACVH